MREKLVSWIRENVPGYAIIGISGGKDSTIVAALCAEALGPERVIGVSIPNGEQEDIADAYAVFDTLGIVRKEINIGAAYTNLSIQTISKTTSQGDYGKEMIETNLPARLRMCVLYAIGAKYPNSRVINTCNYSEDYIGWSTKYGDSAGDVSPLGNLTVSEIIALGDEMGLSYDLVHKVPSDGMCGVSDEEKIGFSYEELDAWLLKGETGPNFDKIKRMHDASRHKYKPMPTFTPERGQ